MDILIFANGELASLSKSIITFSPHNYNILDVTYRISDLIPYIEKSKKLIALIDVTMDSVAFDQIMSLLKAKRMKAMVIVRDVKEGFGYLSRGATDMIICPPTDRDTIHSQHFANNLISKLNKVLKEYDDTGRILKETYNKRIDQIIAIGASTGGTEIILKILKTLPKDSPPVLIVQHMPPVFTKMYSQRLNGICAMSVWEASDGDVLEPGLALLAPGEMQMRLRYENNRYSVSCKKEGSYGGHCPSVDVMFNSVASIAGQKAMGIILTGMGADGAEGLLNMRKRGSYTLGQDEKTSIVYGMPKVANDIGAVIHQGSPEDISNMILSKIK